MLIKEKIKYKKYIVILFSFFYFVFSFSNTYADVCKIEEGPAPVLTDYIDNVRVVISNIGEEVGKNEPDQVEGTIDTLTDNAYSKIKTDIIEGFNLLIDWNGYFSSFSYYVWLPLKTEVPYEIKRDHNLIEKELDYLNGYLYSLSEDLLVNTEISDPCKGLSTVKCDLKGDAKNIILKLIDNTGKIGDLYRKSIQDEKYSFDESKLTLIPETFINDMGTYYNYHTITDCSSKEGGYMERIGKAFKDLANVGAWGASGIQEWKNAWNLLVGDLPGGNLENYREREREVLRRELGRQGIGGNSAEIIMGNLERYNSVGFTPENNFITNSFNTFTSSVGKQVANFKRDFLQVFNKSKEENEDSASLDNIRKKNEKVNSTKNIKEKIAKLHLKEYNTLSIQDGYAMQSELKLIEMHSDIVSAIKILDKTIPVSEKVCNAQGNGLGICSYK